MSVSKETHGQPAGTPARECTLSINVARPDVPFLPLIIPHISRTFKHPFLERMLVVDTAPLTHPRYANAASQETLEQLCEKFKAEGHIDSYVRVDYSKDRVREINRKHFGKPLSETHDFRGTPVYAYLYGYEAARGRYFLHMDSDLLMHQAPGRDWVGEAIALMEKHPDIISSTPLAGPPTPDFSLPQQAISFHEDPRGFFAFKFISTRRMLVSRERYESMLPLPLRRLPLRARVGAFFKRKGTLGGWEGMISQALNSTPMVRADLRSRDAWTLHTVDRGPAFIAALPSIIERVEAGWFPEGQAGYYDLNMGLWTEPAGAGSATG